MHHEYRVLVIDDNIAIHDDFRKILCRPAKEHDVDLRKLEQGLFGGSQKEELFPSFSVDFATQGADGLTMLIQSMKEGRPYALAFVDGRMPPGWDGIETIRKLWEHVPDLQVVLATAFSDYSWPEIQGELGVTDGLLILKKPFDNSEVLQMAFALARKWALNNEVRGKVNQLTFYDKLTGLPNRGLLLDRFNETLLGALDAEGASKIAVLFLDIDKFRRINESIGFGGGDRILMMITQRLMESLRHFGPGHRFEASRLNADEFIVVVPDIGSHERAAQLARRIMDVIGTPFDLVAQRPTLTACIGISMFPEDADNPERLIQNAESAMVHAKARGPAEMQFYKNSMNEQALKRLRMEAALGEAIDRAELALVYQPQYVLASGELSGFEVLLRWCHKEFGQVSPDVFIPIAEDSGLIRRIGYWVIEHVCEQVWSWIEHGLDVPRVSINVSVKQFSDDEFVSAVNRALTRFGLPSGLIELEITEGLLEDDTDAVLSKLELLKGNSLRIAIDDFGQGYSCLSRLNVMPIDCLKIDRAFVRGINSSRSEEAIIIAIIAMAKGMGLNTIAEGVEHQYQKDFLIEHGCHEVQGYLVGRPMSPENARALMRSTAQVCCV